MRPLFRRRYQPKTIVQDIAFWSLVIGLIGLALLVIPQLVMAFKTKPQCVIYDARHNIGVDESGRLCKRREG